MFVYRLNMEYNSESSCESHLRDLQATKEPSELKEQQQKKGGQASHFSVTLPSHSSKDVPKQPNLSLDAANKSLSAQVMEYYEKYSHSSNLDQYFSLPASNIPTESVKYYYDVYELNSKLGNSRQDCIGEEYHLPAYVPRERRRWVRPPLIGQSSSTESSTLYIQPLTNPQSPSPDLKHVTTSERSSDIKNESQEVLLEGNERKIFSPTSSVASHKPLEWDSGADVGYYNSLPHNKHNNKKLSTIERMALARGCSAALRLDPEGTTESGVIGRSMTMQHNSKSLQNPKASSTLITENISESESEIEITPIMKNMLPGIITGSDIKSEKKHSPKHSKLSLTTQNLKEKDSSTSSPKSSYILKVPSVKHSIERKQPINNKNIDNEDFCQNSLLKKSTSMNTITPTTFKNILKRSQSELNLYAKDKNKVTLPLIFNSTSSISTVVNKPTTCDKVIQTSLNTFPQESVGIQVSVQEEEKPPLPKRGTSLQRSLQSILKNPKSTYKIQNSQTNRNDHKSGVACVRKETRNKTYHSSSDISQSESIPLTPQFDEAENISGRVNSFEYFPGHIYENVPNRSGSHVSSIDTGESNSTFPNTSSSLSEKLWGNSNSLVRDLERSVNILKSLVDANKCDKQVKKRLIHHVVKRLVTARYADDKIDHNIEDNIPWHADDARQKVYQTESLHASKKKHSTTTSSDNWKTSTKSCSIPKSMKNDQEIITQETLVSSNSDKFDGNTDRTEMDGRKARMSLRTDDCPQSSNTTTEPDRSESSECFVPQKNQKGNKMKNAFCLKEKCKVLQRNDTTSTNSTPPDRNRILLDAVLSRKTSTSSSKNIENNTDSQWRFPTTLSERQFELKRCQSSNPGDLKLVDYAEMEKRNQLLWITNEISHLSNLKKLLEQPRRLERSKSSPRKLKPALFKTKPVYVMMQEKSVDTDFAYKNPSNSKGNFIGEQWSSHCNLATCHSTDTDYTNNIQRTKKRNSSSQTATEVVDAHSRTGGEIITTSKAQNTMKLVNTGIQTYHQEIFPITSCIQNGTTHPSKCLIHKSLTHSSNKCKYVNQEEQDEKDTLQAIPNACLYCPQGQSQNPSIKNRCHIPIKYDFTKEDSETATESTRLSCTNSNSVSSSQQNHRYMDKSKNQLKQKETKNQINASKSKYACNCQSTLKAYHNKCKCDINKMNKKTTYQNTQPEICPIHIKPAMEIIGNIAFCELCHARTYSAYRNSCTCKKQEKPTESTSMPMNGCKCTNEVIDETQTNMFTMRSDRSCFQDSRPVTDCNNQQKVVNLCGCSKDYSYENKLESESCMPNASHETCSNLKTEYNRRYHSESCSKAERYQIHTRPYYLINTEENETSLQPKVQTRVKCNCSKDCSCPNKIKEDDSNSHRTKHNTESNDINGSNSNDSNKNYKCCRTCGKVYQNTRKCNCRQTYPKPVAYEISFTKENSQKNISTIKKMPLSNTINDAIKSEKCTCTSKRQKENNKNDKTTLQDYLSKNKPEFVNNAETRRQYVSEIAHLRQLRKEKRIQLLAMASTSNSIKFPKLNKPAVNVQKRITDEEIKERLRKRYRRLNEVRVKRREQERQEETRRNKLMAKIFCKKLQQKVLRGQVDLSQSVSVISNI
ncbi:PREDICTED: uncharacterized protein LOC106788316 [Polistes canadensis]|uniref:uncharacterized protein LOC106788316 n=1 Tax=Polistes canadensis TaxID=91411 RepID=UPI000718BB48|nr:PREDICTED: uncharacterized protein LOC106788316 [Polistes canadensis]